MQVGSKNVNALKKCKQAQKVWMLWKNASGLKNAIFLSGAGCTKTCSCEGKLN
jgi:hypothetical protein